MKGVLVLCLIVFILMISCTLAEVKVDVVSERTTLENQVLGTYNALDEEMLLVASVRGVDSTGNIKKPPKKSQEHRDAVMALQVLSFHEDDLHSFKQMKWVGENMDGLLSIFTIEKNNIPDEFKGFAKRYKEEEFRHVVSEINKAREIVMQRVIDLNEDFGDKDLPTVRRIFGKLNTENALPGEKTQKEDGKWIIKK